jgi:hypothetical protein
MMGLPRVALNFSLVVYQINRNLLATVKSTGYPTAQSLCRQGGTRPVYVLRFSVIYRFLFLFSPIGHYLFA